ncbi:MAG: PAS domain S-box protein [Candidatus Hydrogenedentes bacterium]|nr:PAS domain S-box protein [Candidatus Hydrogenedentota bacterium]
MTPTSQHDVAELTAAFDQFNQTAVALRTAYEDLQARVKELDQELESKNRELAAQVDEVNRVKDYLSDLLASITDGVIATDMDGRITAFNLAAERITGFSASQMIGKLYRSVFSDDIDQALAQPDVRPSSGEYTSTEIVTRDGGRIPVGQSISTVRDAAGAMTGAVKVFHDLSEITMLREHVRQKDRLAALGEMAATVAHEIRNPLGGIEGFAALLARDFDKDDPRLRLVNKIMEGAKSLDRVVTDLLEFTRPLNLRFRECDCREIADNALSFAEPQIIDRDISVERCYSETEVRAAVDNDMLGRVMLNLVLNAVQSMDQNGTLTITIDRRAARHTDEGPRPAMADIRVADTGCGMDEKLLDKVFDPFFTTREKGTGLGLAIARRIVEGHNGTISIDSEVGRGTTVRIELPLSGSKSISET